MFFPGRLGESVASDARLDLAEHPAQRRGVGWPAGFKTEPTSLVAWTDLARGID